MLQFMYELLPTLDFIIMWPSIDPSYWTFHTALGHEAKKMKSFLTLFGAKDYDVWRVPGCTYRWIEADEKHNDIPPRMGGSGRAAQIHKSQSLPGMKSAPAQQPFRSSAEKILLSSPSLARTLIRRWSKQRSVLTEPRLDECRRRPIDVRPKRGSPLFRAII